jgi:hypothetical protein
MRICGIVRVWFGSNMCVTGTSLYCHSLDPKERGEAATPHPSTKHRTTMSIYFGRRIPPAQTHPLFRQRGVEGFAPITAASSSMFGMTSDKQIAYDGYSSNIDIFLAATNRQQRLNTTAEGAKLTPRGDLFPLQLDPVALFLKPKTSHDQMQALVAKFASLQPEIRSAGSTPYIAIRKMVYKAVPTLMQLSHEPARGAEGAMSLRTYLAVMHVQICITEFLATNTYPAFTSPKDAMDGDIDETAERRTRLELDGVFRRFRREDSDIIQERKRVVREGGGDEAGASLEIDSDADEDTYEDIRTIDVAVAVAKPSPIPATMNYGEVQACPTNLPGRAFPYFPGMLLSDKTFIRTKVAHLFKRTFGSTHSEITDEYKQWRSYIESYLGSIHAGEMSHILMGIDLALQTQTRLFLVLSSSSYAGFVLFGERWSIFLDTLEWVSAASPGQLGEQIAGLSSHHNALNEIARRLSDVVLTANGTPTTTKSKLERGDIDTALKLFEELRIRDRSKVGVDVTRFFSQLVYATPYRIIGPSSIARALAEMASPSQPLLPGTPLFIPPSLPSEFFADKTYQVLATFGPESFSFLNSSGASFTIAHPQKEETAADYHQDAKTGKRTILIMRKGFPAAYHDMRSVLNSRTYRFDPKERAGKNRNLFYDDDKRDEIVRALRELVWHDTPKDGVGSKRSRDGDVVEGVAKKKKLISIDSVLDMELDF